MKLQHIHDPEPPDKDDVIAHVRDCVIRDCQHVKETGEQPRAGGWRLRRRDGRYFGGDHGSVPNWADPYVSLAIVSGDAISAEGRFGYPSLSLAVGTDVDFSDEHYRAHLEEVIEHELFTHGRQQPTRAVRSHHLPKAHWKTYSPFTLVDRTYFGWLAYYTRPTEIEAWVKGMIRYARLRQLPLLTVFDMRMASIKKSRSTDLSGEELNELTSKIKADWLDYATELGVI